jgi:putative transposase
MRLLYRDDGHGSHSLSQHDHPYRFVLQDRDIIFPREVDKAVPRLGVRVLRSPVRAPKTNAFCERLGGSLHRECLDVQIPFNEGHLRRIVKEWMLHDNRGRPHGS